MMNSLIGYFILYLYATFLRKRLQKRLVQMFPTISEAAVGSMVPSKTAVQTVKLLTHSEETVLVYVVDGEPLFVDNDGFVFPTGQKHNRVLLVNCELLV